MMRLCNMGGQERQQGSLPSISTGVSNSCLKLNRTKTKLLVFSTDLPPPQCWYMANPSFQARYPEAALSTSLVPTPHAQLVTPLALPSHWMKILLRTTSTVNSRGSALAVAYSLFWLTSWSDPPKSLGHITSLLRNPQWLPSHSE